MTFLIMKHDEFYVVLFLVTIVVRFNMENFCYKENKNLMVKVQVISLLLIS